MAYYPLKVKDNSGNTHVVGDPRTADKADKASPTFTGTPAAPTAAPDTNTTQIATTAFVIGQAGSAAPVVNGTAAVGTSLRYSRQDHVHGTDTTRAPLASPTFTGTVVLPSTTSIGSVTSTELGYVDGVTSAIQTQLDAKAPLSISTNARTDSYTLVLADAGKLIEMGKATAQTLTIPLNSSVAFPVGTKIDVLQTGAGETTIAGASGVTVNSEGGKLKINAQWQAVSLVKRATDTWVAIGALKS